MRGAPGSGIAITVALLPGTLQLLLFRATGSWTLTRVVGTLSADCEAVVEVMRRPCESRATTSVDSWVMVLPSASVLIFVILNSAV